MQLENEKKSNNKKSHVLVDVVYEGIKDMILKEEIKSGEKIQEQEISKKLSVSRTPIREAIRKLAMEGILNYYPNRCAEVISFDEETIKDLGIVRIFSDILAAQLAILHGSNNDFINLKKIAEKCKEATLAEDEYNRIKYDADFHLLLVEIGLNPYLIDIQKNLYLKIRILQTIHPDFKIKQTSIDEHLMIVEKLFERDIDQVIKLIYEHLELFYDANMTNVRTIIFNVK